MRNKGSWFDLTGLASSTGHRMPLLCISQPIMQPTIEHTCTYLEGLTQPSATCKLLKVRESYRLKRLSSTIAGIERVHLARVVALEEIGRQGSARSAKGPSKHRDTKARARPFILWVYDVLARHSPIKSR